MRFLRNIQNGSNWNIGFCDMSSEDFISKKCLGRVHWMKHDYKDRFFADPFILNVSQSDITVLAEEYIFDCPPGKIVELVVDRQTKRLKHRYEVLALPTHLSYPAIMNIDDTVWVYPENGAAGKLSIYRYDAVNHRLIEPHCILQGAVADATILRKENGDYLLTATRYPDNQSCVFAYETRSLYDGFSLSDHSPFQRSSKYSRPAGNFFHAFGSVYRPAQDCSDRYGGGISVMRFDPDTYRETFCFSIRPVSYRYSLGIHTINFAGTICVVDGYGYKYPTLGRIYASKMMKTIRDFMKNLLAYGS